MSGLEGTPTKDRKRSAHWSDEETTELVRILARHGDGGRAHETGFRPEVWTEVSERLEGMRTEGGLKTEEACKSRWQRLQRDFKNVQHILTLPGFAWDDEHHRVLASDATWAAIKDGPLSRQELAKLRRLCLPSYRDMQRLCEVDPRRQYLKTRPSLGSVSESSSSIKTVGTSHTAGGTPNGVGSSSDLSTTGLHGLPGQLGHGRAPWGAELDGEGALDAIMLANQAHDSPAYLHTAKRAYDPALLPQATNSLSLGPKRPRPSLVPSSSVDGDPGQSSAQVHGHSASDIYNVALGLPTPGQFGTMAVPSPMYLEPAAHPQHTHTTHAAHAGPSTMTSTSLPSTPGASALHGLAPAIERVLGLPEAIRRGEAIRRVECEDLAEMEQVAAMREFQRDMAAVDTYLAIGKATTRAAWLRDLVSRGP